MTANRWWVRYAARWLARFKTTEGQLRSFSLAITAFSTFSLMLQNAGLGEFIPWVGTAGAVGWLVYSKLYSEGGVHNQAQRDMSDLSSNYSTPRDKIDDTLIGTAVFAAVHEREPSDEELEVIEDSVSKKWGEFREGVDLEVDG